MRDVHANPLSLELTHARLPFPRFVKTYTEPPQPIRLEYRGLRSQRNRLPAISSYAHARKARCSALPKSTDLSSMREKVNP